MPKTIYSVLFILTFFLIGSCKKVDIAFGNYYLDNNYTQIIKVDTFSSQVSTVFIDSFVTSNKGLLWLGGYTDPEFGVIKTKAYVEMVPPAYTNTYANTTFDSLELIIRLNKSYYADTTKSLNLNVRRLSQLITPYTTSPQGIFNTQQFSTFITPIGTANVVIRPEIQDSISIRLSDALGKEFLAKLQDPQNIEMKTATDFLQYFNGIEISSNVGNSVLIGCKDSLIMRLHYKVQSLFNAAAKIDFTLPNPAATTTGTLNRFTYINTDNSGTVMSGFNPLVKEISSTSMSNAGYSQYLSRMMTKIRFPNIRDIMKLPNYQKLVKANLIIRPVIGSYSPFLYLPPTLSLDLTTQLNYIGSNISTISGPNANKQTGNLYIDDVYGQNTNYTYDVTDYIRHLIADATINQNGILLVPNGDLNYSTQFNRLKIGDKNNPNGKLELQLFYIAVQ
jgi:hypothetical protein